MNPWNILEGLVLMGIAAAMTLLGRFISNQELTRRIVELEKWRAKFEGRIEGRLQERFKDEQEE